MVDPLVLDRHLDRYRRGKRKLIDMCGTYGVAVDADDLHAADADVLATLDLVHAIAGRYPAVGTVELERPARSAGRGPPRVGNRVRRVAAQQGHH